MSVGAVFRRAAAGAVHPTSWALGAIAALPTLWQLVRSAGAGRSPEELLAAASDVALRYATEPGFARAFWCALAARLAVAAVLAVLAIIASAALVFATASRHQGREAGVVAAWTTGIARFWPFLGVGVLMNCLILAAASFLAFGFLLPAGALTAEGTTLAAVFALLFGPPMLLVVLAAKLIARLGRCACVVRGSDVADALEEAWRVLLAAPGSVVGGALLANLFSSLVVGLAVGPGLALAALASVLGYRTAALWALVATGCCAAVALPYAMAFEWGFWTGLYLNLARARRAPAHRRPKEPLPHAFIVAEDGSVPGAL